MKFEIHPAIGIARVGNSPQEFYLAPETTGGLPIECTAQGDEIHASGKPMPVTKFKDATGRIKRQAARFRIYVYDDGGGPGREIDIARDVKSITWTVHIANKKAAWYQFSELQGDLMLGPDNSYEKCGVDLRNATITEGRQKLIIDPGPRSLTQPGSIARFSKDTIPPDYKFGSFPDKPTQGQAITTLGEMRLDSAGRLLVLGGFGRAGGNESILSFAGADTWHDDIADGQVKCKLTLPDDTTVELDAWVIIGSPKFAPELVNIVTLGDLMFDVGVRYLGLAPEMYDLQRWPTNQGWNPDYIANYERDVQTLMKRVVGYQWVANVPTMTAFAVPPFNPRDNSPELLEARKTYFSYWRKPGSSEVATDGQENTLLSPGGVPLMPLNSGTNSVSNALIDKFLALTETQYFLLGQWAQGKFKTGEAEDFGLHPLDTGSVGNAVGSPMCPGIEVTWSTRNPALYTCALHIAQDPTDYNSEGLNPSRDETEGGGCQPGDLTKRMAIPWQADFFQCTVQFVNFTDATVNKAGGIPLPPTYYAYWWPPQSPMFVMTPTNGAHEQLQTGVPSGFQVYYPRGINSFAEMITAWSYLGFIANRNTAPERSDYPTFEEVERNNDRFVVSSVAVGNVDNFVNNTDSYFAPMWFLRSEAADGVPGAATALKAAASAAAPAAVGEEEEPIKPIFTGRRDSYPSEPTLMEADVVIVGGGPAGAAAALTLRRYTTREVILVERSDYQEPRVGETIGPGVEALLAYLGIDERFLCHQHQRSHATAAAWGSAEVLEQHFLFTGHGDGWQLDRNRFDRMLADAAREVGATVLTGTRALSVERDNRGGWHIAAQRGQEELFALSASYVIDAGGRAATFTRKFGAEPQRLDGLVGVTAYIEFDLNRDGSRSESDCAAETLHMHETLVEAVEEGWWYSSGLPDGRLVVVLMSDSDIVRRLSAHTLAGWLDLLAEAQHTRLRVVGGKRPTHLIVRSAASHLLRPAGGEGWLAAGDALAAFDPLSAMGIGHALNSGAHAGRVADAVLRGDRTPQAQYQAAAEQIMTQYLTLRQRYYGVERRWSDHPFWRRRAA